MSSFYISPQTTKPYPKASRQLRGRKNTKKGNPEIFTSSSYKNSLKSEIKEKNGKIKNKAIAAKKKKTRREKRLRTDKKG